jgi:hypothetical protein
LAPADVAVPLTVPVPAADLADFGPHLRQLAREAGRNGLAVPAALRRRIVAAELADALDRPLVGCEHNG